MPDWVKLVGKYGGATALAGYLVYFLVGTVNGHLKNIEKALELHQVDTSYYVKSVDELRRNGEQTKQILQQICINGSSLKDRPNCFARF